MRQFKTTTIYSLSSVGIFAFLSVLLSGCDSADKKYECIDNYTGEVVKDDLCKEDSSSANIITSTTFIPNTSNSSQIYNSKDIPTIKRYNLKVNPSSTAKNGYFSNSSVNGKASGLAGKMAVKIN